MDSYRSLGGQSVVTATVDEILVEKGRARGVRIDDGTLIAADAVISTSSTPETILRLLGGRFDAAAMRERLEHWKLFQPIVLASFGVATPLREAPGILVVEGVPPYTIGGVTRERLGLRVCNDDPFLAPPGHAVVQAMLDTDYAWWATRGVGYQAAKEEVAQIAQAQIERVLPEVRTRVRMTDIATPLTFWRQARSWRGAYEGWEPNAESLAGHVNKRLAGLQGLYLAGQWVEPGGGVPMAVMSGRQAVQILCDDDRRPFQSNPSAALGSSPKSAA